MKMALALTLTFSYAASVCARTTLTSDQTTLTRERRLGPLIGTSWAHTRDVQQSLHDLVDGALGAATVANGAKNRTARIANALRPIYKALPKNELGLLGHSAVRYALHRYFVKNHGMYVKGFDPAGDAWASSASPTLILEDRVPAYVQHLFEERLRHGFSVEELALLAGTFEHFIHDEAVSKLQKAYQLKGLAFDDSVSRANFSDALDVYMFITLMGDIPAEELEATMEKASDLYPGWSEIQSLVHGVESEVLQPTDTGVTVQVAKQIVGTITQRFGRHQDAECRGLENLLLAKEIRGTGRIWLSDFYQAGWNFKEHADYLKKIGAIDEASSDKEGAQQRVIVSNYITSATNCISTSSMFSVCCIDQCEDLLAHLEQDIAAPDAKPERIMELIAALPSATVSTPRHLSKSLVSHLHDIAKSHGGRVPLHGRLFAQWMHHAYPRECPFPAKAGATKPLTPDDWLLETNMPVEASDESITELIQQAQEREEHAPVKDLVDGDMESTLPWLLEEELVFNHHRKPTVKHELLVVTRALVAVAVLFSLGHVLLQLLGPVAGTKSSNPKSACV